jgi:uncharacterized protein YjbJ (UPF0337 family)
VNRDQAKGAAYKLVGKMQEITGRVIGSKDLQIKGIQKQVLGNADTAIGNAKRDVTRLTALAVSSDQTRIAFKHDSIFER